MTCKYKVKIKDIQYNYKVQMTDIQSKYKFKVFCTGYDDSEIKDKIDTMYEAWPKASGEGETITLNDTANTTMTIDLKGNTSQEGTPTPETPQDIHVVTGDNEVVVCGKNLLDLNRTLGTPSDTTYANTTKRTFDFSKFLVGITGNNYYLPTNITSYAVANNSVKINTISGGYGVGFPIKVKANQTYKLSYNISESTSQNTSAGFYQSDGTYISYVQAAGTDNYLNITTPSNCDFMVVVFRPQPNTETTYSNIMLEYGTTSSPYQPYTSQTYPINLGDIELCKIGDYQDRIYKDSGKWYLHKEIGKHIITDSDISLISSYWYSTYGQYGAGIPKTNLGLPDTTTNRKSLCNVSNKIDEQTNIADNTYIFNANAKYVFFFGSSFDTKEHANEKLVGAEVYFNLDTPTTTEITDSTLLSQLEAIKEAESYSGQTNISQTNDDKSFILTAKALKDLSNL